MIGIICGEKGSGKTKRLLKLANERAKEAKGSVVFIDVDNSCMFDLATNVRFINSSEYEVDTTDMLLGFISGIAAQDFDLECIYIDKFRKLPPTELNTLAPFFDSLKAFADKRGFDVVFNIGTVQENLPDFMLPYLIPAAE